MREGFWGKSTECRNTEGEILTDGNNVINKWKEYSQDLYEVTQDMEGLPEWLPIRQPSVIDRQEQKKSYKQLKAEK
jgi:hypothetical protein